MQEGDEAVVVTGDQITRSKSMDGMLKGLIRRNGFQPSQVTLPHQAPHRVITEPLLVTDLTDPMLIQSIFVRRNRHRCFDLSYASEKDAAKILVDSVINTGNTILEFVRHIRSLHGTIRIVVVEGVVQERLIKRSRTAHQLVSTEQLSFVALRISENSYTGKDWWTLEQDYTARRGLLFMDLLWHRILVRWDPSLHTTPRSRFENGALEIFRMVLIELW